jgi:hypothetical protein
MEGLKMQLEYADPNTAVISVKMDIEDRKEMNRCTDLIKDKLTSIGLSTYTIPIMATNPPSIRLYFVPWHYRHQYEMNSIFLTGIKILESPLRDPKSIFNLLNSIGVHNPHIRKQKKTAIRIVELKQ